MNTFKLLVMAKGPRDRRDEASKVVELAVTSKRSGVAVAKAVDCHGICGFDQGDTFSPNGIGDGYRLATGHGVTVVYPDGRMREVRA